MADPFTETPTETEPSSYLAMLAAEDDRNKDPEFLAKRYVNSSSHIKKIEEENKALREQADAISSQKALIEELKKEFKAGSSTQLTPASETTPQTIEDSPDIASMVQRELAKLRGEESSKTNMETAAKLLGEKVGAGNMAATIQAKAKEMGVSEQFLKSTAAQSPNAFMAFFASTSPSKTPSTTTGSVNTMGLTEWRPATLDSLEARKAELRATPRNKRGKDWLKEDTALTYEIIQARKG